jgi:ubiquinone/menaquinone biosynthesis C-methylase UbiE
MRSKNWDRHVGDLQEMAASPGFQRLRDAIISKSRPQPDDVAVDIGAGTGLLALALAPLVERVIAVDNSSEMCRHLERERNARALPLDVVCASADQLDLPSRSADLVVSNYCYHHLTDAVKDVALAEAYRVLKPGGRIVIGDMMFGFKPTSRRDRRVVLVLVKRMLRKGPAGVWRILKNLGRWLTRRWEHPASDQWWNAALERAGFDGVSVETLDNEAGIAVAFKPPAAGARSSGRRRRQGRVFAPAAAQHDVGDYHGGQRDHQDHHRRRVDDRRDTEPQRREDPQRQRRGTGA